MLHVRDLGLLDLGALTVTGRTLGENLATWEKSERRARFKEILWREDGVAAEDVIMSPAQARARGLTSTVSFPRGNIAPEGSVIKATAIDPSVVDADGVYRKTGPAKIFISEKEAIAAIKRGAIQAGDVMVLMGCGPLGTGMEETYQLTSALKHLPFGKQVALVTDARFSGVSTGACIGHVGPEALAGGPIAKLRDGDMIRIEVNRLTLESKLEVLTDIEDRPPHPLLAPNPALPDDTRLWAALQQVGGGTWGGCVYDPDAIIQALAQSSCVKSK